MKGTVAIIGANQTGLFAAKLFSEQGFSVFVFEKNSRENAAYEWTDDISPSVFKEVGLPFPPNDIFTRARLLTFVPPGHNPVFVPKKEEEPDINVSRRGLNEWLISLLPEEVELYFDACVTRALTDGDVVYGVEFSNGETFECDLVVDCGGVNSLVRRSLPQIFQIQNEVSANDKFFVKREFFARPENCPCPEHPKKTYLKHKNENGISWCFLKKDDETADVLVGRIGSLSDETYENALADIRRDNEIVGDKIVTGGQLLQIPVRHPLSRFVANGYALLGDSACMTIPMLGSGMASGMKAGKMLSEVISAPVTENPFSVENLYRYQARFMKEIGGKHAAVDMMKNWLLNSKKGDVDFLLGKGVVSRKVLIEASAGHMIVMSPAEMAQAAVKGIAKLPLLLNLASLLQKMKKECKTASNMPKYYDEAAFSKWEEKYEKPFRK